MNLTVGQMVTCTFINNLPTADVPEGASIHWHGIELDNDSDGTAVTQDGVLEGQSYTYRFVAPRPGLFWFHSHMVPGDTLWAGMYGVLIVHSPCEAQLIATNGLPGTNATFILAMTDTEWDTRTNSATFGHVGRVSGGEFQTINEWIHTCGGTNTTPAGGANGVCGTASFPGNTVLVNGYNPNTSSNAVTFPVQSGQMVRLQLLNEALTRSFYLELEKTNYPPLIRIGGQGGLLNNARLEGGNTAAGPTQNNYTPPWNTLYDKGAILLSSGMRSDVVLTIPPGLTNGATVTLYGLPLLSNNRANGTTQWPLMQQITTPYPIAYFNVTNQFGGNNPPIADGSPLLQGTACQVANLTNGNVTVTNFINPAPFAGSTNGTIKLTSNATGGNSEPSVDGLDLSLLAAYPNGNPLDGNMGNGTVWSVPRLPTSRYAHVGDLLILTVTNLTGGQNNLAHPFHLHGFSMQPLSMVDASGVHNFGYNEFLDTIDVYSGQALVFSVLLEDRKKYCDQSSGTGVGLNSGPVLAPCGAAAGTPGGALGRWLYHCHIGAHGVLGMMGEIVVLGNAQQSMTFQPPDTTTNGVDVMATFGTGSQTVADDFPWQNPGPINHVTIWGSWTNDVVDPNATFELKFWTDVPAFNGTPSRPGWQAWEQLFPPGAYSYTAYANPPYEGFYDPSKPLWVPQGDTQVWQYDFDIPNLTNAFYPPAGSYTNWLSVTAYPTVPNAFFGWKSCPPAYQWNDDASWSTTTYGPNWTDLHYPFGHPYYPSSMDMAFQLFTPGVASGTPSFSALVAPPHPVLSASMSGGQLTISWSGGGVLQYADQVTGPWNDVDSATSPYLAPTDGPQGFYRVRMP
jgi:FtsP/CotA-like multicopper oxidase with cupredoxin domain